MKKTIRLTATIVASLILLPSCQNSYTGLKKEILIGVTPGMTKELVAKQLGQPFVNRGAMIQEDGTVCEVWEYSVNDRWQGYIPLTSSYIFYFVDGKLKQFGRSNDWQAPSDHVQEFRVR